MKYRKLLLLSVLTGSLLAVSSSTSLANNSVSSDANPQFQILCVSADNANYSLLFDMLSKHSSVSMHDNAYIEMRFKSILQHLDASFSQDIELIRIDKKVQYDDTGCVSVDAAPLSEDSIASTKKFNIEKLQIAEEHVYSGMRQFLDKYKKKHFTEYYCETIMKSFIDLIEEDGSNIYSVLYFMALCSVESNFDQNVPTKYGVGIAQVVYRIHKKYISELGVSKDEFYHSPSHNIYVGYNIFKCYLKSNKYSCHRAAARYNGGATKGYADHVTRRFNFLLSLIKQLHYRKT